MECPEATTLSLSGMFLRKGIIAESAEELDPSIQGRLNTLKQLCREACGDAGGDHKSMTAAGATTALRELQSGIQLWKERSLHHTLEAMDSVSQGADTMESHIQAMEHYEKATKDIFALLLTVLTRTWQQLHHHLDEFAADLAGMLRELIKPDLEQQLQVQREAMHALEAEKLRLQSDNLELQMANAELTARIEMLEISPEGGGDALLCSKLRVRVHHLSIRQRELLAEVETMAQERLLNRRELATTKAQLEASQKALALTRAMHEKETKQLAGLVQLNHEQVAQVLEASRSVTSPGRQQHFVERYDPLSGRTILYASPSASPRKPSGSPSRGACRLASVPAPPSPNVKPRVAPMHSSQQQRSYTQRPRSAAPATSGRMLTSSRPGTPTSTSSRANKAQWSSSS